MGECCKTGFQWSGTPAGKELSLGSNKAYVTGSNKDVAILIVHDVFGWTLPNTRLLADAYAKEANATVYLPDYFGGEVVAPEMLEDPEKAKSFDLMAFIGRNSKEKRGPEIFEGAKQLKKEYKKVGAIGFCYGGWAVFQLGAKGNNIIDACSTAHPSLLDHDEIKKLGVPTQILAPEQDPMFTEELKEFANKTIPTLGIAYDYQYFPGVAHGFAVRGDPKNPAQKEALERAKNAASAFFLHHLHDV